MYLLNELVKEHQKELLNEAKIARKFQRTGDDASKFQASLRMKIGNFLIVSGLKLKGQYQSASKSTHASCIVS